MGFSKCIALCLFHYLNVCCGSSARVNDNLGPSLVNLWLYLSFVKSNLIQSSNVAAVHLMILEDTLMDMMK